LSIVCVLSKNSRKRGKTLLFIKELLLLFG